MRRFSFSWSLAAEVIRLATFSCKEPWVLIGLLAVVDRAAVRRAAATAAGRPGSTSCTWPLFVGLLVAGLGGRRVARPDLGAGRLVGDRSAAGRDPDPLRHGPGPLLADRLVRARLARDRPAVRGPAERRLRRRPARPADRPGLGPAEHRPALARHGRLRRGDGDHPARGPALLRLPVPQPRLARAGRPGAAHRALADGVALPVVLGDPVARRLRPDPPRPGGPLRPALADRLPRPVRALADAGRLLPADGPGERRASPARSASSRPSCWSTAPSRPIPTSASPWSPRRP